MKPKKPTDPVYPEQKDRPAMAVNEAAQVLDSVTLRPVVSVREAKDQLSALLQRASQGEQIVITSDGQPKAMIVRYRPVLRGNPWKSLKDFRDRQPMQPDSLVLIDEDRADRG